MAALRTSNEKSYFLLPDPANPSLGPALLLLLFLVLADDDQLAHRAPQPVAVLILLLDPGAPASEFHKVGRRRKRTQTNIY